MGKPSTVQKSLTEAFSNTVWDLSLARKFGPLIIGPSRTYLSNIFMLIYIGEPRIPVNIKQKNNTQVYIDTLQYTLLTHMY